MGAGQGQDRERLAALAVQGGVSVPARGDPAAARGAVEDAVVPRVLFRARAIAVACTPGEAKLGCQHRDRWPGDVGRRRAQGAPQPVVEQAEINRLAGERP